MRVWASPLGGYPRSRAVRRALRDYEKGLLSYGDLERIVGEASAAIIGAQVSAGLAYVVDGMIDWHDIFRPLTSSWRNVTATGLLRYFDNNFFYRIPLFTGEPEANTLAWAPRVRRYSPLAEPSSLKIILPGPLSFTEMSSNNSGSSFEELAEAMAKLLANEAKAAVEAGALMVQVDEPILGDPEISRDKAALAVELVNRIASTIGGVKTVFATYFDVPRSDVYEELLNVKTACLAVDIMDAPERAVKLIESKGFGGHCGVLGLINSRTVYDDDLEKLLEVAAALSKHVGVEELGVTTTTWLDLIPYRYSLKKTFLLGLLASRFSERIGGELIREEG